MIYRFCGIFLVKLSHFRMKLVGRHSITGLTLVIVQHHIFGSELLNWFFAQSILNQYFRLILTKAFSWVIVAVASSFISHFSIYLLVMGATHIKKVVIILQMWWFLFFVVKGGVFAGLSWFVRHVLNKENFLYGWLASGCRCACSVVLRLYAGLLWLILVKIWLLLGRFLLAWTWRFMDVGVLVLLVLDVELRIW